MQQQQQRKQKHTYIKLTTAPPKHTINIKQTNNQQQSLALAHANVDDADNVLLSAWTETDFRTGEAPWWK
jgi:hypothetical protein